MARTYSKLSGSREVLAILVETDSHHAVCSVERCLHTISMVYIDINIEYASVVSEMDVSHASDR